MPGILRILTAHGATLLGLAGAAACTHGLALIYPPLAWLFTGGLAILLAVMLARQNNAR